MNNKNSKQLMRIPNTELGRKFLRTFRNDLNKARYSVRVRGRKPDHELMSKDGLRHNYFSRDGSIPFKYATELAVYVEALPVSAKIAKCLNCDELKKEIASLGVEIATLDNLNKQIETLQHHKSKLGLKINWTAQPSKMMNKKIQYYNDDVINQWKIRVTALKTEVCKLRLELGTSAHVRATRGVMITDLEAMMVKRDERIDKLKDILHTVHRENKLLKQRVDDREGTIHVLKHRIDARGGTIEGLRRELITMHRVATALDKKNKEKIKHINRLKREYHTVREILHYVSKLFNGGK